MTVKLNSLQVCFGLSILFHLLIFSAVMYGGWGSRPPKLPEPEPVITLRLMAAPDEIVVTPARPVMPMPAPPKVEPVKMVEPVAPIKKVEEPASVKIAEPLPVVPVVKPTPPEKISGDGSYPSPALIDDHPGSTAGQGAAGLFKKSRSAVSVGGASPPSGRTGFARGEGFGPRPRRERRRQKIIRLPAAG